MNAFKRVLIIIGIFSLFFLLSESIIVESINDRGILVGIGIDYKDENYVVTGEVLTGGAPDSEQSGFSKLIQGKGDTVSTAIQDLYKLTGKQPSLGLCSVIVLGQSVYMNLPVNDCLVYFTLSSSFRDGSMVVCAENSAEEILSTAAPISQSPSFALSEIIQKSSKSLTVPNNNLQEFMNSQMTLSEGGLLNVVSVIDSELSNDLDDQAQDNITQGNFSVKHTALFSQYRFIDILSLQEVQGYCLFKEKGVYQGFQVLENSPQLPTMMPKTASLSVTNKKIKSDCQLVDGIPTLNIEITMKMKRSIVDNNEKLSVLMPKDDVFVSEHMLKQVETQARDLISQTIEKSKNSDCDFCQISYDFYKKYGYEWSNFAHQNPDYLLDNLQTKITVKCYL